MHKQMFITVILKKSTKSQKTGWKGSWNVKAMATILQMVKSLPPTDFWHGLIYFKNCVIAARNAY